MNEQPKWIANEEAACMQKWMEFLHEEAKRLFIQDGTHGSLLFSFSKENGLVSVNPVPSKIDHEQLNDAIANAVIEHDLFGVIFIGETWMYRIKENDHTAFQLLDGEMNVSDLNENDKQEALLIRMENCDGNCMIYLDEILRDENGHSLKEGKLIQSERKNWFIELEK